MATARGLAFAILLLGTAAGAQTSSDRAYGLFGFGAAGERTDGVRNALGLAAQFGIGRQWEPRIAGEFALDGAWFPRSSPTPVGYACVATGCGPVGAAPGNVMMSSLTANVVLSDGRQSGAFCRAGLGLRALLADPQYAGRKSAVAQLDFGGAIHDDAGTWLIGPRFQGTIDRATPRWTISMLLTRRLEPR